MIYTKEKFKELWEANENGITFDDIADCAMAWGISSHPRTRPIDEIRYKVLIATQVNDAEEYNPNLTSQCDERIMIDLDKACEWLRNNWRNYVDIVSDGVIICFEHLENDFRKAMKGDE